MTMGDAPGASAPGEPDRLPELRRQAAPGAQAPAAQGQQPGRSKTAKDKARIKAAAPPLGPDVVDDEDQRAVAKAPAARSKTTKDKTRDKAAAAARPLGPDVVDDKGQRVPFSRRGWETPDSDDGDDKTTTVPRASRPAKPGLPMPRQDGADLGGQQEPGSTSLRGARPRRAVARRGAGLYGEDKRVRKQRLQINANARPNVFRLLSQVSRITKCNRTGWYLGSYDQQPEVRAAATDHGQSND
jgi:hypothetical protein